jgi:hypothetical protein
MSYQDRKEDTDKDNSTEFFEMVLRNEPKSPGSIQIEIDTNDAQGMFEFFLMFMTHALASWYGKPVDLQKVTEAKLQRLAEYYASFGIRFMCISEPEPDVYMLNNKRYLELDKLEDMCFQAVSGGKLWTLRFRFLMT